MTSSRVRAQKDAQVCRKPDVAGHCVKVVIVEVVIAELGPNQYKQKPKPVNDVDSEKRLGYNRPGYDHLYVVLVLKRTPKDGIETKPPQD